MAQIPQEYKELFHAAADSLKSLLWSEREEDAKVVQKGLLLYRQGLVTNVRIDEDLTTAVVQDVTPTEVELDLNFLQISTCTCPAEGFCRHQLAVFFQIYSRIGSVTDWVEDWRTPLQEKKLAQSLGLKKAKDLLKTQGAVKPDYDAWIANFKESFGTIMGNGAYIKPHVVKELFRVYSRKIKAAAPFEHEWKKLYFLIASLHSLHHLFQLPVDMGHSDEEVDRYYVDLFPSMMDEIEDHIKKININAMPFAFDAFIEKLKDDSFFLLNDDFGLQEERITLYITLWTEFFKKQNWREAELVKIDEEWKKQNTFALHLGRIHQTIMLGDDDRALELIQSIKHTAGSYMPIWFIYWTERQEWQRMGPFVEHFVTILHDYLRTIRDSYDRMDTAKWAIETLIPYLSKNNKYDLYEKLLVQSLPYSYWIYEDHLFHIGMYERWADLQIFIGYSIDAIPYERIKYLQREEPHVLLPIYHQSIQKHIAMKNRGNYREAVRELKKLRTLYRKLKRQKDWDQFLQLLLEKNKRLRAFQEECERGKLIHA